jgi:hypothetical protein
MPKVQRLYKDFSDEYTEDIESSFAIEEKEVKSLVKEASRKDRVTVPYAVRSRISRAIVLIHNMARYYEGMAILCSLAGWKPRCLENEFDPPEERMRVRKQMNAWIRSITSG